MDFKEGEICYIDRDPNNKCEIEAVASCYVRIRPLNFSTDNYWYSKSGVFRWAKGTFHDSGSDKNEV